MLIKRDLGSSSGNGSRLGVSGVSNLIQVFPGCNSKSKNNSVFSEKVCSWVSIVLSGLPLTIEMVLNCLSDEGPGMTTMDKVVVTFFLEES